MALRHQYCLGANHLTGERTKLVIFQLLMRVELVYEKTTIAAEKE